MYIGIMQTFSVRCYIICNDKKMSLLKKTTQQATVCTCMCFSENRNKLAIYIYITHSLTNNNPFFPTHNNFLRFEHFFHNNLVRFYFITRQESKCISIIIITWKARNSKKGFFPFYLQYYGFHCTSLWHDLLMAF